ncbi:MAG: YdcF family protein [Candidatus Tokpelaia sp.]|uniref:YdcF family protein n=1 Tax=Candidatus Tokpelaia sp. TaxID=2233777 RepID=UPI00123876D8|nr:YdcF family protein [Candidatus Tokpelaia sp.]KAA6205608.1 MAG: YdcF family protein [Candidatus Tokpelaia sp.]KAA6206282.1 MAG: YdcF family protein [Candidatus Tokpelaia sp.]KAA6406283.1 YdcF family protein [Candidatus Tokpelaia sp.]
MQGQKGEAGQISTPEPPRGKSALWYCGVGGGGFLLLALLFFLLGFALFVARTSTVSQPGPEISIDAIIVLTGGRARVETGLALLRERRGTRLLISGVSPIIGGRHDFARILGADPELLECCVDLGREALNTSGNALESAAWVKKHNYHKVLIVTNRYHILRSLAELRHQMPQTELVPFPVEQTGGVFRSSENFRLFVSEYIKFLVVWARNFTGWPARP